MNSTQIEFKKKQKTSFCKNLFFYYYCRIITEVSMRYEDKTKIKKLSKNKYLEVYYLFYWLFVVG
jgi:hypothetical protein